MLIGIDSWLGGDGGDGGDGGGGGGGGGGVNSDAGVTNDTKLTDGISQPSRENIKVELSISSTKFLYQIRNSVPPSPNYTRR